MKNPKASSLDGQEHSADLEETFLRRWSRLKLDAANGTPDGAEDTPEVATADLHQEFKNSDPVLEQSQLELTDEDMPPLETLDENSDYSGFLSPKVSETLRRQALRKLFHLPQLNIADGLNDYDEDYTHFEKLGNVVTHEMKRLLQQEAEKMQADVSGMQNQDTTVQDVKQTDNSDKVVAHKTERSLENNESNDTKTNIKY